MKKPVHFLNGKLVTEEELLLSARDLGFTRGYAVFDFLITYHNKPFKLSEHIDRLLHSAALIDLKVPWSKKQIMQWVHEALDANEKDEEKTIKIMISGGASNTMFVSPTPTILVIVDPHHPTSEEEIEKGVGVMTVKHTRYAPEAKTNNYIEAVKQHQKAIKLKADELFYYDDKQVFEGARSNIFALIDGKLLTPKSNKLAGITRAVLLDILKLDVPVVEKDFTLKQLLEAEEVFFTGSGKEVVPVTKIDGKKVGNGQVGSVTKEVIQQFRDYTLSGNWS